MRKMTKRTAVIVTAAVVAAGGGAAAWAWSLSGEGSASATAETVKPLTVGPGTLAEGLAPSGSVPLTFVVFNPNKFPVKLTAAQFSITSITNKCPTDDITVISGADATVLTDTIGAAGSAPNQRSFTVPAAVSMSKGASDDCQGAVVTVHVTVNASTV